MSFVREDLLVEEISTDIGQSLETFVIITIDQMILETNLTVNQSVILDRFDRVSPPETVAIFQKPPNALGFIKCEVDGLFENLLMTFFEDEPRRLQPLLDNINGLIVNYEDKVRSLTNELISNSIFRSPGSSWKMQHWRVS